MKGAHDVIAKAGRLNPELTLSWTAAHAEMMDAKFSQRVHASLAQTWKRDAPETFAAWMDQHANEPSAALMPEGENEPKPS